MIHNLTGYDDAARHSASAAAVAAALSQSQTMKNKPGCRLHEPTTSSSSNSHDGNFVAQNNKRMLEWCLLRLVFKTEAYL